MRERASCGWLDLFVSLYACMCACVPACVCVCKSRGCQAKTTWQCRALTQLGWAGMSSHVPSWCVCAQCAHTAARPNLWSSFLLTLTHSFPLSHLSVFHLSTSLLSALSPLPLSGPCSLLPPCMKSPFTPRVYTKILPLNATHILCPPPQKKKQKTDGTSFPFSSFHPPLWAPLLPPSFPHVSFHPAGVALILTGSPPVYSLFSPTF